MEVTIEAVATAVVWAFTPVHFLVSFAFLSLRKHWFLKGLCCMRVS